MHQDEGTGLWVDDHGNPVRIPRPPLAELREEQEAHFGHWTAERDVL